MPAFDIPQLIALAAVLGFASGIRLYAVLLITGLVGYAGWVELPGGLAILQHPWVLAASGTMFAVEFVADKIPGVDTVWDAIQTFVRIPAGAALAAGVFGGMDSAAWTTVAAMSAVHSRRHHFTKAGTRAPPYSPSPPNAAISRGDTESMDCVARAELSFVASASSSRCSARYMVAAQTRRFIAFVGADRWLPPNQCSARSGR